MKKSNLDVITKRDEELQFDPLQHSYHCMVGGLRKKCLSVTTVVAQEFPKFDAIRISNSVAQNVGSKYYGKDPKSIRQEWKKNGAEAAAAGTKMHNSIEEMLQDEKTLLAPSFTPDGDPEYNQFLEWRGKNLNLKPFMLEWKIYDEDWGIAGTIDAVFKDENDNFHIVDWKRCKKIETEAFGNKKSLNMNIPDCNFAKYSLQLFLYRAILERKYGILINPNHVKIVCCHPNQKTANELVALNLEEEVYEIANGLSESDFVVEGIA